MEYEVNNMPDFEGLEEAKTLLFCPKRRRLEVGVDVMLTAQGLSTEQKRRKNKRRIERLSASKVGTKEKLKKHYYVSVPTIARPEARKKNT